MAAAAPVVASASTLTVPAGAFAVAPATATGAALLSGGGAVAGGAAATGGAAYMSGANAVAATAGTTAASGGLMASIGAAMPWLAAAAVLVSIFRKRKKYQNYTVYSDLPRYDLQGDMRTAQDRMFNPSIASGTTPIGMPGGGVVPGITGYDLYSQGNSPMLGLSGFGSVRGFGGFGGGTMTNVPNKQMFMPQQWTGYGANTNYGSGYGILNAPTETRKVVRMLRGTGGNLQRQAIEKMTTFTPHINPLS